MGIRIKVKAFCLCVVIQVLAFAGLPWASGAQAIWPIVGHDNQHTSASPFLGPQTLTQPRVIDIDPSLRPGSSAPVVIDASGIMYVLAMGSDNLGRVYALNPDGSPKLGWPFVAPPGLTLSSNGLAIGVDGEIYATFGNKVFSILPSGLAKWANPFTTEGSIGTHPVIDAQGNLYITIVDGLYAINSNGTLRWKVSGADQTAALGSDGTVFISGGPNVRQSGGFTALSPDGNIEWESSYGGTLVNPSRFATPVVASDGTVYTVRWFSANLPNTTLLGIEPTTGDIKYQRPVPAFPIEQSLAIAPDGTVIYTSVDGITGQSRVSGFSPDLSSVRFEYVASHIFTTSPVIAADGILYFVSSNGEESKITALTTTGIITSEYTIAGAFLNSGAISFDGSLIFMSRCCSSDNWWRLYVFETGFLSFPLHNKTPLTAKINSVFDHSMTAPYCPDGVVKAYNGEEGRSTFGISPFFIAFKDCTHPP